MNMPRLTVLAWLLATAAYGTRAFLAVAPGGDLLWTGYLQGAMDGYLVGAVMLWALAGGFNILAVFRRRQPGPLATGWHLAMAVLCGIFCGQTLAGCLGLPHGTVQALDISRVLGTTATGRFAAFLNGLGGLIDPAHVLMLLSTFVCLAIPAVQQEMRRGSGGSLPTPHDSIVVFLALNVIAYFGFGAAGLDVRSVFVFGIASGYALAALGACRSTAVEDTRPDPRTIARMWAVRFGRTRGFGGLQETLERHHGLFPTPRPRRPRRPSVEPVPTYLP